MVMYTSEGARMWKRYVRVLHAARAMCVSAWAHVSGCQLLDARSAEQVVVPPFAFALEVSV